MSDGDRLWHDRRWHAAVLAGDDVAWRAGYDAAFESVRGYVRWRAAGMSDLADDALQETWLTAVRRIADFDPARGSFATWVCGIAGNVIRNSLRSRQRQSSRIGALARSLSGEEPPNFEADRAELTARALAELPAHYEAALRDKYLRGKTVAAMATDRNETVKAVESLLTRARSAFREIFARLSEADG